MRASRLLAAAVMLGAAAGARGAGPFEWPGGARCAVSLTYDDALESGRLNAAPALEKAGFKGTFFLSGPVMDDPAKLRRWIPIAKAGHELGVHTLLHPCPAATKIGKPGDALEDYDLG